MKGILSYSFIIQFMDQIRNQMNYTYIYRSCWNPPVVRGAFEIPVQPFPQTMTVELEWDGTLA